MASTTARHSKPAERRDATINLRLPAKVRDLIDSAAAANGTTRTEFVLESARRRAIDVMLDRRLLLVDDADWKAFQHALDHPPPPNAALKALMARKPPWKE